MEPRLRKALRSSGLADEAIDRYVTPLREPGAATAALNWYRAAPYSKRLTGSITVPTLYVYATDDAFLTRKAADHTGPVPTPADDVGRRLLALRGAGVLAVRDTGAHDDTAVRLAVGGDGEVQVVACGRFLSSRGHYFPGVYEPTDPDRLADAALAEAAA